MRLSLRDPTGKHDVTLITMDRDVGEWLAQWFTPADGVIVARQSRCDRIASPEMFPEAEMLPHLICSRPILIGGASDEADQYGGA